ncbi:putative Ig domain-containing protein [uncultured Algibacter sp.]|uniref:putative Ig domain-containing protein n=1 Tax=uncultured Algibacter sp. TaxID=298659 RepID=UPI00260D3E65|nr:putative Ig domain-containing protein [uncultured Algibacter sp.]
MKKTIAIFAIAVSLFSCSDVKKSDFVYQPNYPENELYILTPKAKEAPKVNGPSVFGVRPGSPFLYTIPASGNRPMEFSVTNLPEGLSVDSKTGMISGTILDKTKKEYIVSFNAKNKKGEASKTFTIKVGDEICLTPPLGWNSWNCWENYVDQDKVLRSARAMVNKGLINYGYSYVNVDCAWQGKRGENMAIQPNLQRFPNIKAMYDEIHQLGLKAGIYSSPWVTSYGGFIGGGSDTEDGYWDSTMQDPKRTPVKIAKYKHVGKYCFEKQDVQQWIEWGVDYLKYDWAPNDSLSTVNMANALADSSRDIVYSISNTTPISLAKVCEQYVHVWRTGGDLKDRWIGKGRGWSFSKVWDEQKKWQEQGSYGKVGRYLDPDMLVVGNVSTGTDGVSIQPSLLTADEQYTHISLWALWSSPMLIGSSIENMDAFTLNLLTNTEVLDINQDPQCVSGKTIYSKDGIEIVVKDLDNGEKAIGLFNKNETEQVVKLDWALANLEGIKVVRDVWRNQDIGKFENSFSTSVRPHGTVLITIK